MTDAIASAEALLREALGPRLRTGFGLAPLTTFRIGGPAALYVEAESDADLEAVAAVIARTDVPFVVLGKGSNVLVSDDGFPGLVLRLGRGFRWIARDGDAFTAGASTPLPALASEASRHGLSGLAFGVAIPGTLGGAVRMNAGAHGHEMQEVIGEIGVISLTDGVRATIDRANAGFAYRRTAISPEVVVVSATLLLTPGDRDEILAAMAEARQWRRATQPLAEPNCGSVFTNPIGEHAARLIEGAGLKGARVGGAVVSAKHANFIVAEPGASASDVRALIGRVRDEVLRVSGVELATEVRVIGVTDAG